MPISTRYLFYGLNHTAADPNTGARYATAFADSAGLALTVPDDGGGGGTVPEPSTLALLSLGLVGIGVSRRRKAN